MAETPTLDKMLTVKDQSQAIGEFLDWLEGEGLVLCRHDGDHYVGHYESTEALLARHSSTSTWTPPSARSAPSWPSWPRPVPDGHREGPTELRMAHVARLQRAVAVLDAGTRRIYFDWQQRWHHPHPELETP